MNYGRLAAYIGGAVLALGAATGCASISSVSRLERQVQALGQNVKRVKETPLADKPFMFTMGHGYDKDLGMLLQSVISKYEDPKSKEEARKYADAVTLVPLPNKGYYFAVVMVDDGNQKPNEDGDRTLPDSKGGKLVHGQIIGGNDIPKSLKDRMINVGTSAGQ